MSDDSQTDQVRELYKQLDAIPAFWGWNLNHLAGRLGLTEAILALVEQVCTDRAIEELRKVPNHTAVNLYIRERTKALKAERSRDE
jgi:hypothetical protein